VQEADPDERRQVAVVMDGTLELAEQLPSPVRRRRDEARVSRPSVADPVQRAPQLAQQLLATSNPGHQSAIGLPQVAQRDVRAGVTANLVPPHADLHVVAALRVAARPDIRGPVVTVACDLWDRYRSTPWMKDWEAREAQGLVFVPPAQPKS